MKRPVLIGLLALAWSAVSAQPTTGGPQPGTVDPTAIPLDGGASLLLAAGATYGWGRLRARRGRR